MHNRKRTGNNSKLDCNSIARSFIYIKNSEDFSIEPWGTAALTLVHVGNCPFKISLPYFLKNNIAKVYNKFPEIQLYIEYT